MFARCSMLIIVALAALTTGVRAETKPQKPNIVIIMADDMGFSDIGCYGSEIATPNLDRLAGGGMRFTQFYNNARCCPTRASLLTGLYPHQAGVGAMVGKGPTPAYQGYLNDHCVTIAEALKQEGYRTLMAGKWHVGEDRPHWPCDRGFDEYFGLISGASNYFSIDPGRKFARGNEQIDPAGDGFYMTDAFAAEAVKFLDKYGRQPQPFFLYVAFTSPHWPLHAWPEDIAKYRGKYQLGWDALREQRHKRQIEMGIVDAKWPLSPRDAKAPAWADATDKDDLDLRMAVYAAQIDRMDQNIGKVLAKLDEVGASKNTLIMFLADNGGCAEVVDRGKKGVPAGGKDSFFSYGLPWANASNTPFRLYKHWVHEGGISTPLIASWPGVIEKRGTITREVGHLVDLMATSLDAAGIEYPATYNNKPVTPLEGKSLAPIFRTGTRKGHEALFWEHEGNRAVREGKWKLVSRNPDKWELYDIEADRTELNNLAEQQPDRAKAMAEKYQSWADRVGALPRNEADGKKKPKAK
jgi:arylsulfatase A-like enzyme